MAEGLPKLIVLAGGDEVGTEIFLAGNDRLYVGRSDENHLMLSDTSVSRRHVSFSLKDGIWSVSDESSRNGTFLNDTKLESEAKAPLSNMDVIRLGIYELRFIEREVTDIEIREKTGYHKL